MTIRLILLGAATAAVAACGGESTAPTPEQARELDRAGEMLDQAPNSLADVDDNRLDTANAAEPAPR